MKTNALPPLPAPVDELYAELRKVLPSAPANRLANPEPSANGSVLLGFAQNAWTDDSFGWEPSNETPAQKYCWQPRYHACPLGGRFYHVCHSIGD